MTTYRLDCHPETPCPAVERIEVTLDAAARGGMRLCYRMIGDAQSVIAAPASSGPARRDGLWRRTCCELFVAAAAGPGYREYNFAPSGDWAAYRFSGYRAGRAAADVPPPRIAFERSADAVTLTAVVADPAFDARPGRRIGIACVVETGAGLSCWALAHTAGRPDFHDPGSFAQLTGFDAAVPPANEAMRCT